MLSVRWRETEGQKSICEYLAAVFCIGLCFKQNPLMHLLYCKGSLYVDAFLRAFHHPLYHTVKKQ